jgi:hypothetical protein
MFHQEKLSCHVRCPRKLKFLVPNLCISILRRYEIPFSRFRVITYGQIDRSVDYGTPFYRVTNTHRIYTFGIKVCDCLSVGMPPFCLLD